MYSLSQFPLPYKKDALAPYMSDATLDFHHGKHLAAYINKLNELIADSEWAQMPLHSVIVRSANSKDEKTKKIFNNAAQIFNHNFFFHNIKPNGGGRVPDEIANAFGGSDAFRTAFKAAATDLFGSGWIWLARADDGKPTIIKTPNADTPIAHGMRPIITLDVWEHAYYLDYQNRRGDFADAFLDRLVNWEFAMENMAL